MANEKGFQSHTAFRAEHPRALAMYCSDGRFTDAVEELLRSLGHDRLDTITLPGGPALLHPFSALIIDHEAVASAARFLIRGHALTHVVLIAHKECGYYKSRFAGEGSERIERRQKDDLRAAREYLQGGHAGLKVDLFYAMTGTHVHFDPVK